MQLIYVYLYNNTLDVFTNISSLWTKERYRRVYNRNIKAYTGADNVLNLQVRNADEKATALSTTLVFNIIARDSKKLLLQKDAVSDSSGTGRYTVTLTQEDLQGFVPGFYDFSLVSEERSITDSTDYIVNSRTPLYTDSQYAVTSTIEILSSVYGEVLESQRINNFNYVDPAAVGEEDLPFYESSIISGKPYQNNSDSTFTFQIFLTNYSGTIELQGSLDETSAPKNWSTIQTLNFTDENNSQFQNVTGKYHWFRLRHTPEEDSTGTVDYFFFR